MKNKLLLDRLNGEKPYSEEYINDMLEAIDQKAATPAWPF